jgi:hypothetical protein
MAGIGKAAMHWTLAAAGLAMAAGVASAQTAQLHEQGRAGSTLGTPEQIEIDRRAVRIYQSREVQKAIDELAEIYARDTIADQPDARPTLHRAAEAMAIAQTFGVVAADPDWPVAAWGTTGPHAWRDVFVPVAGVMIDNPDRRRGELCD